MMSKPTDAERLIREARERAKDFSDGSILTRLADALEACRARERQIGKKWQDDYIAVCKQRDEFKVTADQLLARERVAIKERDEATRRLDHAQKFTTESRCSAQECLRRAASKDETNRWIGIVADLEHIEDLLYNRTSVESEDANTLNCSCETCRDAKPVGANDDH